MMTLMATAGTGVSAAKLVEAGKPNAVIVIDKQATRSARLAALELRRHIERITGAALPITDAPADSERVWILVGESPRSRELGLKSADFKKQEYLVKVKGNRVILMGRDKDDFGEVDYAKARTFPNIFDEIGSCYAVYDFLEKLGVRWYLPTELGTAFSPSRELEIADVETRRAPFMKYREVFNAPYVEGLAIDNIDSEKKLKPLSQRDTELFKLRQRLGGERISVNHSLYTFYDRFLKTHPEWFAKGYNDERPPQLCYNNPEVLRQVVQDARDFFDGKVDAAKLISNVPPGFKSNVFPVFPMDNNQWCKCSACQAQLKPKAERGAGQFSNDRASDYIFGFVNKVAEETRKTHPDKFIGAGTYGEFCYPPEKIKLAPNIMTAHCFHSRMIYAKQSQENEDIILAAWKKSYPDLPKVIWMYYCFPTLTATNQQFRCFPGFFAGHVKDYTRKYIDAGVTGLFIEPSYMGKPLKNGVLMDQLEIYINWKLADDPTLDPDALFSEFFTRYYGEAAEPARQFYQLVSDTFCDPGNYPSVKHQNEEIAWTRLGTKERMARLGELMERAKNAANSAPYKQRVELFDQGVWQYMLKGARDYRERGALMAPTMQHVAAPALVNKEPGNPLTVTWDKAARIALRYGMKADLIKRDLSAWLAHDGQYFYIRYEEKNVDIDKLRRGDYVWLNDEWESFFAKQRGKPYNQLGVDAAGKWAGMEYEGTVNQHWDFKGRVISQADPTGGTWTVYLAIPLDHVVMNGVKPGETLYFNVIRSSKTEYVGSWIPTFGGFHAPSRFGEVYLEK